MNVSHFGDDFFDDFWVILMIFVFPFFFRKNQEQTFNFRINPFLALLVLNFLILLFCNAAGRGACKFAPLGSASKVNPAATSKY